MAGYLVDQPSSALRRPYAVDTPVQPDTSWTEAEAMPGSELGRGFNAGLHGSLANIQAFGAAMADSMGFRDSAAKMKESALRRAQIAGAASPFINQTGQIEDLSSALQYGAGAVGQAAGSLLPTGAAAVVGGAPGAFASLVPMSGGEVAMRHYQEPTGATPQEVLGASAAQGLVQGGVNMLPIMSIVGKGPLAAATSKLLGTASPVGKFAGRMGATMVGEGLQEAGEEYTAQQAMQALRGQPMGAPTDVEAIKEAGIAGAVGMAPFGAVHGAVGGANDAGGVMGLRARAEMRRAAALAGQAGEAVQKSGIGQAVGEVGEHLKGIAGEEFEDADTLEKKLAAAEGVVRRAIYDAPAMAERVKEGLGESKLELTAGIMRKMRYDELHDYASKLAERADWAEGENDGGALARHGEDLIDMGQRLNQRIEKLDKADQRTVETVLQYENEPGAVANSPELRRAVAQAFLKEMEKDKVASAEDALKLIGKKLRGTKKSLSATSQDPIGDLLVEMGFAPAHTREQALTSDLEKMEASRKAPLTTEALLRAQPRPKTTQRGPIGSQPGGTMTTGQSESSIAVWQLFDNEYRPVETVDRVVRAFGKLITHIAKGEANPDEAARVEEAMVDFAGTPEAKLRLREIFAKAHEMMALDPSNKDARRKFAKDMRELVSGKRVPLTKALSQMAGRTLSQQELLGYLKSYSEADKSLTGLTPEQQQMRLMKLRSAIAERFGLENVPKAEAITRHLLGLDRREARSPTEAGGEQPERAATPFVLEDEEDVFGEGRPQEGVPLDRQTMGFGEEEGETEDGLQVAGGVEEAPVEFGGVTYDYERPFSGHKIFGSKNKAGQRVSDIEAQRERYQMKVPGGSYYTVPVTERLAQRYVEAVNEGGTPDTEADAEQFVKRAMAHSAEEAEQARSYLEGLKINIDKLLADARRESVDASSPAKEIVQQAKSRFDTAEFFKKAVGGNEDAAYALNAIYWHDVRKQFADEFPASVFFRTFPYRFPAFRSKEETHSEKTDWAIKNEGLIPTPEDGAQAARGELAIEIVSPEGGMDAAVLSLPKYLAHKLHAEDKPVAREGIATVLGELINHLSQSKDIKLTEEASKALGLGRGRMNAGLLLIELPDGTQIRGRDVSGIPHETPIRGVFSEHVAPESLTPKRLKGPALAAAKKDPSTVVVGDEAVSLPAEVKKAAAALGATEDNLLRLNVAQVANAVDKVLTAMEERFPGWERSSLSEETVVGEKNGKPITMRTLEPFRVNLPAESRAYAVPVESDMTVGKTSERNMQDYADMLAARLADMGKGEGLQKTSTERALEGQREMLGHLRRMKARGHAKVDEAIAKLEGDTAETARQHAKWLAGQVEKAKGQKIDWAKVKLAEQAAIREFENEGVAPGPTMDPHYNAYGEESEAYRDGKKASTYPVNADEVYGRWLGVMQRLEGMRFGEEDWMDAIPTEHDKMEFREGTKYVARDTDKIVSTLRDDEAAREAPPVHNPLAPKEKYTPAQIKQAQEEFAAKQAEPAAKPLEAVAENYLSDVDWAMAMAGDVKVSAKKFSEAVAARGLDPFVIDQIMNKLGKGLRDNALRRSLEPVLEKALAEAPETKQSLSGTGKGPAHETELSELEQKKDAIRKENIRLFGKQAAELNFKPMNAAGEYSEDTGVMVSTVANNMWSAAGHEYVHHLFKLLREAKGDGAKAIDVLIKNTTNPAMLEKARELLTTGLDAKRAEALLERFDNDPEERVAYLYELRVAGLMDPFNPPAEGAIKRIFKWIREMLGFVPSEQQLQNLMEAWTSGKLASDLDSPGAIARAMGQEKRIALAYRSVEKAVKPIAKAVANAFTPSYDLIKQLNNPGLTKLAEAYGSFDTDDTGRLGIVHERDRMVRKMENGFEPLLRDFSKADRDAALQEILRGNPQSALAQKIAEELKKYTADPVPNVLDRERIEENYDEFVKDVKITGANDPGSVRRALWGDELGQMFGNVPLPQFEFLNDDKRAKWQRQTLEEYLGGFIKQHAAKVTREAAFGKDAEKLKAMLAEAKAHGMSDADEALAKKFVAGAEGWLGKDLDPNVRKLQGALMTGLNLVHLPYSVLSAMVDPIYIGVRSASLQEAFNAYALGIKSIFDTFGQKEGRLSGDAAKFAEDVGLIAQAGIVEPMGDFFSAMSLEGASKKVNAAFFRWNLLQGWERAMFAASAMAAQRFLIKHAQGTDEHSAEYLKELGVKPEDITVRQDGMLATFEDDGITKEQAARIQNAIYKFSHQSAARPTAMSNTIWMNDPHYALIAHMKRFIMAQSSGVLAWMEKQRDAKNFYPLLLAASAVPIQLASGMVRNMFTGGKSMPTDFLSALMQGASEAGLMGRWHFGYDVMNSAYHGLGAGVGVDALAGPAVQDVMAIFKDIRHGKK